MFGWQKERENKAIVETMAQIEEKSKERDAELKASIARLAKKVTRLEDLVMYEDEEGEEDGPP